MCCLKQETGKSMLREGNANGIASSMEKPAIPIRNFGKTVEEFTDYCKNLMENENTDNNSCSDNTLNDSAVAVSRHPSRKKARSAAAIVLNISNAMPVSLHSFLMKVRLGFVEIVALLPFNWLTYKTSRLFTFSTLNEYDTFHDFMVNLLKAQPTNKACNYVL